MASSNFELYSDGGAELGDSAAGACILRGGEKEYRLVAFMGVGTNNEAEIFSALMGFAAIRALGAKDVAVHWVSDSEYTLKSATQYIFNWQKNGWKTANRQPVKNQGLWRAYLDLVRGMKITPEHVRGHTGHPENEACDAACNYVRPQGVELLAAPGEGALVDESWILVDGRSILDKIRAAVFAAEVIPEFEAKLKALL